MPRSDHFTSIRCVRNKSFSISTEIQSIEIRWSKYVLIEFTFVALWPSQLIFISDRQLAPANTYTSIWKYGIWIWVKLGSLRKRFASTVFVAVYLIEKICAHEKCRSFLNREHDKSLNITVFFFCAYFTVDWIDRRQTMCNHNLSDFNLDSTQTFDNHLE